MNENIINFKIISENQRRYKPSKTHFESCQTFVRDVKSTFGSSSYFKPYLNFKEVGLCLSRV